METRRTGPAGETIDTSRHRALGSTRRAAILRLVRGTTSGMTTNEVATATGLHVSTVRAHLDLLAGSGLLVRERAGGGTPGRPAWRYRAAAPAPAPGPYRMLAAALLDHVVSDDAGGADRRAAGARAGEGWGRRLADAHASDTDPVDAVVRVLDGLGFAPRAVAGHPSKPAELHLHACPFSDLVATDAEAMCGLHLGMIRGVLHARAAHGDSVVLEPFGAPDACTVRLPTPPALRELR